jgi:hypothetical protein
MEVSVRELIREAKNAVNARFDMLEHVISISTSPNSTNSNEVSKLYSLINQQNDEINSIKTMLYRFNDLISNIMQKIETMENHTVKELTPLPSLSELLPHLVITPKPQLTARSHHDDDYEDNIAKNACEENEIHGALEEEEAAEEEAAEEETAEEAEEAPEEEAPEEEAAEEAAEEEAAEEETAEEEGIELEEFEYKGMTLYRDTENKVYRMDEDGALSEPLGLWDESGPKPRIKKLSNII